MAKFVKEWLIELKDVVEFDYTLPDGKSIRLKGIVQDISNLPEVWVETGDPRIEWSGEPSDVVGYRRFRLSLYQLIPFEPANGGTLTIRSDVRYYHNEPIEFVYNNENEQIIHRK